LKVANLKLRLDILALREAKASRNSRAMSRRAGSASPRRSYIEKPPTRTIVKVSKYSRMARTLSFENSNTMQAV